MAQQTRLPRRTLAEEAADTVVAGATVQAVALHTVVLVRLAVLADVTVDADALVAALGVLAGAVVLAGVGVGALVHVLGAVAALPVGRAAAGVGADTIHTGGPVLAKIARAVVDVLLTVVPGEPCKQNFLNSFTHNFVMTFIFALIYLFSHILYLLFLLY